MYKKYFYWVVIPAFLVFTVVMIAPFVLGISYSFMPWRGTYFDPNEPMFVGFANYIKVFENPELYRAFGYTIQLESCYHSLLFKCLMSLSAAISMSILSTGMVTVWSGT